MTSVLLVDDDRALRKLLRAYLEQESITVLEAGSGEDGLAMIERTPPSLVLLDVRLPGIDGFEVLRRLEAGGRNVPVILVTSLEDELDQLVGYRLGAMDFVTKPVSPKLLAAKAKAFVSRVGERPEPAATTVVGPLTIEHDAVRALVDGIEVRLTARRVPAAHGARRCIRAGSTPATTCCSRCGVSTRSGSKPVSSISTLRTCGASSPSPAPTVSWRRSEASATASWRSPGS